MTPPRLWLCADLGHTPAGELLPRVLAVLDGVQAVVWLRSPVGHSARELLHITGTLIAAVKPLDGQVYVGDRVDVALSAGAHGAHLSERSLTVADARTVAGAAHRPDLLLSVAVHDAEGMNTQADVVLLSPFGAVPGKSPPLGVDGFAALRAKAPGRFVVALGGIHGPDEVTAAVRAGADGVAVRRALLTADDPVAACRAIDKALTRALGGANPLAFA